TPRPTLFPYTTLFRSFLGTLGLHDLVDDGNREFSQNTGLGNNHFILVFAVLLANQVDLGFEGDQCVANLTLHEGSGRSAAAGVRSEEHTSELQSRENL